ncbi:serine/threonine-protein kinase [Planktothrix mougeotii]|uniref:Serine/threonine protein kinase n=1 Tax=Planktothrix mougeotii LEGE 06226 TaxID=1828728 RepID=A0ABR9UFS4_9CYAN|nr:serine/threonine-protein kinase [Planktothrix mougeotii]MBE9145326.1 serine/threonine protein kinase [Planktothrix mougeotii LEGE 06226]
MTYCLNSNCAKPYNSDQSQFCLSCGNPLRLKDRYRALDIIGQGGFGKTFLAVDEDKPSKPRCVIKQFFPQSQDADAIQKASELFEQEAIRLDELGKHPHIPELLAYITIEQQQYLIQEFIEGENLAKILNQEGAFNETQIQYLLICLLPILEFIHTKNVIHRDIKPANIIRRPNNQFVLVDFGSAKFTQKTAFTVTGTIIGTSDYIAPEQAKGKGVFASDIYSLGVTCLHLLTQVEPIDLFDDEEGIWIWREHLKYPVSEEFGLILDKMIESAIKRRYQSARDILTDLNNKFPNSGEIVVSDNLERLGNNIERLGSETLAPQLINKDQNWECVKTIIAHTWVIYGVAITPDGQNIVSCSEDETIKIWNLKTGELEKTLTGHSGEVSAIAISSDGQTIVSGSYDKTVRLWNLEAGEEISVLVTSESKVESVAIHPHKNIIGMNHSYGKSSSYARVLVKNIDTDKNAYTSSHSVSNIGVIINAITFAASSPFLAYENPQGSIIIAHMNTGETIRELKVPEIDYRFLSLAFSSDTQILASGSGDNTITLWQPATGNLIRSLEGHSGSVYAVAITSDNKILVSGSEDQTIKLWEIETGEEICTLTGHTGIVYSIAISPDNQTIVSGSQDGTIKIWRSVLG